MNYLSFILSEVSGASQVVLVVKNLPADAGDMRCGFDPWVGKIPWRRAWQPTAVFLPGESHGQRRLVGYSPWGHKELDMTEQQRIAQHIAQYRLERGMCVCDLFAVKVVR